MLCMSFMRVSHCVLSGVTWIKALRWLGFSFDAVVMEGLMKSKGKL